MDMLTLEEAKREISGVVDRFIKKLMVPVTVNEYTSMLNFLNVAILIATKVSCSIEDKVEKTVEFKSEWRVNSVSIDARSFTDRYTISCNSGETSYRLSLEIKGVDVTVGAGETSRTLKVVEEWRVI
jgi:hypothetical protein